MLINQKYNRKNMDNKTNILAISWLKIFLFMLIFTATAVSAQDLRSLKKLHKEDMKALKELHGLKSIEIKTGDNGMWYYEACKVVDGQELYGIFDQEKKLIIDIKHTSLVYTNAIIQEGYIPCTFNHFTGGTQVFNLYNYPMPDHFVGTKVDNLNTIYDNKGAIIKDNIEGDLHLYGSWIIVNHKTMYTRELGGHLRLMIINNDTKNMGLLKWNGEEILKNENFLMYVTNKTEKTYNGTYVFNINNNAGALYLENLNVIVPTEYEEIRLEHDSKWFSVRLTTTDVMHKYDSAMGEKFIPKNPGEQLYKEHKYEECIKYYSEAGISDPDSKLYSADALNGIAINQIMILQNHLQAPTANKLKGYNYKECKKVLEDAITILNTAIVQDTSRTNVYKDAIERCNKSMSSLERLNAVRKENSFGNQLLKSVLSGLAEGLKQSAINSINRAVTGGTQTSGNQSVKTSTSTTSSSSSSSYSSSSSSDEGSSEPGEKVLAQIRKVEKNLENEYKYLEAAKQRYEKDPSGAGKAAIESHERSIEGYKRQLEELRK